MIFLVMPISSFSWVNDYYYNYRMPINITNPDNETLMIYSTVNFTLNTATLISTGKMKSDCSDLRVVFNDDTELNRTFLNDTFLGTTGGCNDASSVVMFMTQENITSGTENTTGYYMYYGYTGYGDVPNNTNSIFLSYDSFNRSSLGSQYQSASCTIAENNYIESTVNNRGCQKTLDINSSVILPEYELRYKYYNSGVDGYAGIFLSNASTIDTGTDLLGGSMSYISRTVSESSGQNFVGGYDPGGSSGFTIKRNNGDGSMFNQWFDVRTVHSETDFRTYINGTLVSWNTTNNKNSTWENFTVYGLGFYFNRANTISLDDVLMTRYQDIPPILTLMDEETLNNTINITAYDEKTYANLTFNITISNLTYSITETDLSIFAGVYENLPTGDVDIYITSDGYVQRKFTTLISEDSRFSVKAYLLKTTDGSFTRFHIEDQAGNVISNVDVTAYKYIDFTYQTVETANSDDSGVATMFMDPLTTYIIEFEKSGYTSANYSIQPSSSDYTITLTSVSANEPAGVDLANITYSIQPQWNVTHDNVTFSFTINSFDSKLEWWAFNVTFNTTTYFFSNETTSSGGVNSTTLDLGNGTFHNATLIITASFKKQNVTSPYVITKVHYIWDTPIPQTSIEGLAIYIINNANIGEGGDSARYNTIFFGIGILVLALIVGSTVSGDGSGLVVLGIIGIGMFLGIFVLAPKGDNMFANMGIYFGIAIVAYLSVVFIRGGL